MKINNKTVNEILDIAKDVNSNFSYISPGKYADKNNLAAVFSKAQYYERSIDFMMDMFISFQYVHPFYDGNKRTLFYMYVKLVDEFTDYKVVNKSLLAKSQLAFLEKLISDDEFKIIIKYCTAL